MQAFRRFIFHGSAECVALDVVRQQRAKEDGYACSGYDQKKDGNWPQNGPAVFFARWRGYKLKSLDCDSVLTRLRELITNHPALLVIPSCANKNA